MEKGSSDGSSKPYCIIRELPGDKVVHSRKLTWKPKKGPMKTTVLLKGDFLGFHVSLGECKRHAGSLIHRFRGMEA